MVRGLVILCAVVMLGGCSGESLRLNSEYSDSYSIHYFAYLTSGRDTRVVVRGNPFKMDIGATPKRIAAARRERPPSTAHTTRSRMSLERSCVMQAGLLLQPTS